MPKLLFVVNNPAFFVSHRLEIGRAVVAKGYQVFMACPEGDGIDLIKDAGIDVNIIPVKRDNHGWTAQLGFAYSVYRICKSVRPDICHLITLKTFLVGGVGARLAGVPNRIGSISGLGYLFISQKLTTKVFRCFLKPFFFWVMANKRTSIIFQNTTDRDLIADFAGLSPEKMFLIGGSGVDLNTYFYTEEPKNSVTVVMASRLLIDKGVIEYLEAARQLKRQGVSASFVLAGDPDPVNPVAIHIEQIQPYINDGSVSWHGFCGDVAGLFKNSNLVVLPSYREGFPKVLIEAAAAGRAVVTTDVAGCRDAIVEGETGLLVKVKDVSDLSEKIGYLVEHRHIREKFGENARKRAEEVFCVKNVVDKHMSIYQHACQQTS